MNIYHVNIVFKTNKKSKLNNKQAQKEGERGKHIQAEGYNKRGIQNMMAITISLKTESYRKVLYK